MSNYNLVAESANSTVVGEFIPIKTRATTYQSEAELERAFIELLKSQAYDYLPIKSETDLIKNLRTQLEKLNGYHFSDSEWGHFFFEKLANPNEGVAEKTVKIQEDYVQLLNCDNGETRNIYLLDKTNIHNNSLQVINQYEVDGRYKNRYDVTILVNGLPLVHIELKRRGVALQEAFNQINRYQRDSFWADSGLFQYVQLFVISNGTYTKYYSNTTRQQHTGDTQSKTLKRIQGSNTFEFTSWWADFKNKPIYDLMDFGQTFFAKHTLLSILTRYCVLTTERQLLVMRPYQIAATEHILNRIEVSTNYKKLGTLEAGGYIWHTTGSGKTLTSFKTAQLATQLPYVDKVLFVVDRKDLDYQTMKEYDKFEAGAASANVSTAILRKQLENPNARIIITTIQKLDRFIKKSKAHPVFNQHIVIIFDECHRSQFGNMHKAITHTFKNYHIFGFTGTPIFAKNAYGDQHTAPQTTEQIFGDKLHTYTIVNAIADKNVLPFRIDYIRTTHEAADVNDEKVLLAPERIRQVVQYILEHFAQKTKRNEKLYAFRSLQNIAEAASARNRLGITEVKRDVHLQGFNSILAVSSIEMAKSYYLEFKRQQANLSEPNVLKIATIFSYSANEPEADWDGIDDENSDDTAGLPPSSRDFLKQAIEDYNATFHTTYNTSADKFQNYYKDVSLRMKNREIDLLIVVNMFLTGFDATTLNTLWVDKSLRDHGLLQAFSRTNRILNSVKTFGNIIAFRNLEQATNEAISLFGDENASGIILLKTFAEYYEKGYLENNKEVPSYLDLVAKLQTKFPIGGPIIGESDKKEFVNLYGAILRRTNILTTFDDFAGKEVLTERDSQDYQSIYIDLHEEFKSASKGEQTDINDDVVFEMELIKQVEINIDYILKLIAKYHASNCQNKELATDIYKAIDSSIELRNKRDLIVEFMNNAVPTHPTYENWEHFVKNKNTEELSQIIADEHLNPEATYKFILNAFRDGGINENGTEFAAILPPTTRFAPDQNRSQRKAIVLDKLTTFYNRFFDISNVNHLNPETLA